MYEDTTVVLPTLNEGKSVGRVIGALLRQYRGISVLACDDCSSDETRTVVFSFGKQVQLLSRCGKERGLSASVLDGIAAAKTKFVVVMDGDSQHPAGKVGEIVEGLRAGKGLVVACRDEVPGWPMHRRLISAGAAFLAKARLGLAGKRAPRDVLSGFFGVRGYLAKKTAKRGRFVGAGYKVLFELLKNAGAPLDFAEVGYVFGSRKEGSSKMGLRHFLLFLKSLI